MSVLLRELAAIVAVAAAGWLGLQAIGAHGDAEVTRITLSERTPTAQQRARASLLIDRMERLNPELSRAAERYDPSLAETARERMRELAPPVRR